jgi:hypothetical protein
MNTKNMSKKYLDSKGLSYLWQKIKSDLSEISLTPGPEGPQGEQGSVLYNASTYSNYITNGYESSMRINDLILDNGESVYSRRGNVYRIIDINDDTTGEFESNEIYVETQFNDIPENKRFIIVSKVENKDKSGYTYWALSNARSTSADCNAIQLSNDDIHEKENVVYLDKNLSNSVDINSLFFKVQRNPEYNDVTYNGKSRIIAINENYDEEDAKKCDCLYFSSTSTTNTTRLNTISGTRNAVFEIDNNTGYPYPYLLGTKYSSSDPNVVDGLTKYLGAFDEEGAPETVSKFRCYKNINSSLDEQQLIFLVEDNVSIYNPTRPKVVIETEPVTNLIGSKGEPGKDGDVPYIGSNGNWFIAGVDTGFKSKGDTGIQGNGFYVMSEEDIEFLIQCLNENNIKANRDNIVEILLSEANGNNKGPIDQLLSCGLYEYFGGDDYNFYLIDGYLIGNVSCILEGEHVPYVTYYEMHKIKGEQGPQGPVGEYSQGNNIDITDNTISAKGYVYKQESNAFIEGENHEWLKNTLAPYKVHALTGGEKEAISFSKKVGIDYDYCINCQDKKILSIIYDDNKVNLQKAKILECSGSIGIDGNIIIQTKNTGLLNDVINLKFFNLDSNDKSGEKIILNNNTEYYFSYPNVGINSHTEGSGTIALGIASHSEGEYTLAEGSSSHAEGSCTTAQGNYSHTEGSASIGIGDYSHTEGSATKAQGVASHAEGVYTTAVGEASHTEGKSTNAAGDYSHSEGFATEALGYVSHTEGYCSKTGGFEDTNNLTPGTSSISGAYAHAEGNATLAKGRGSHSEGEKTCASNVASHAEGDHTNAHGYGSHAEGNYTTAVGDYSHVEGVSTEARGEASHAEGYRTKAIGDYSHAEGEDPIAQGFASHAEGCGYYGDEIQEIVIKTFADDYFDNVYEYTGIDFNYFTDTELNNNLNGACIYNHDDTDLENVIGEIIISKYVEGYGDYMPTSTYLKINFYNSNSFDNLQDQDNGKLALVLPRSGSYGDYSHSEGEYTNAIGYASHSEGYDTTSEGDYSHVEGNTTVAFGEASHSEGFYNISDGDYSHSEGYFNTSGGDASHSEGSTNIARGEASHAEGIENKSFGDYSHAEGSGTTALGIASHTEGIYTVANADYSHAEGSCTTANGIGSHVEGYHTEANGDDAHAEGIDTVAEGEAAHAEGYDTTAQGQYSHAEGCYSVTGGDATTNNLTAGTSTNSGAYAHAEGNATMATGVSAHSEGTKTFASGSFSHAEGYNSVTGGDKTKNDLNAGTSSVSGSYAHAEGNATMAKGVGSHSEGKLTFASGTNSHAEGYFTKAIGTNSHAEGNATTAQGNYSHAEGGGTIAEGYCSHAEGSASIGIGDYSHAEGSVTKAQGDYSHAEGNNNLVSGDYSHAEGHDNTIISAPHSHIEGTNNALFLSNSHAEGSDNISHGYISHIEGNFNTVTGYAAHVEGFGNIASGDSAHVEGGISYHESNYKYDVELDSATYNSSTGILECVTESLIPDYVISSCIAANFYHGTGKWDYETYWIKQVERISTTNYKLQLHEDAISCITNGIKPDPSTIGTIIKLSLIIRGNIASGNVSHAEGNYTTAQGFASHAEGSNTKAEGNYSHAEGYGTTAQGQYSHTEGSASIGIGDYSHTEGSATKARGVASHAEGYYSVTGGSTTTNNLIVGSSTDPGAYAHAEGNGTMAQGISSHSEGKKTFASGEASHAEGGSTKASGNYSHAEGNITTAQGNYSHAEGYGTTAQGQYSHTEGRATRTNGYYSHAEGYNSVTGGDATANNLTEGTVLTSGAYAHAEGNATMAKGVSAHSEGTKTFASGDASHAEGSGSIGIGLASHAEGSITTTQGYASHSEGEFTTAQGKASHAEGRGTITTNESEHAEGKYNKSTTGNPGTISSIGIGTSAVRKNAFEVLNNGDTFIHGVGGYDGTNITTKNTKGERLPASIQEVLPKYNKEKRSICFHYNESDGSYNQADADYSFVTGYNNKAHFQQDMLQAGNSFIGGDSNNAYHQNTLVFGKKLFTQWANTFVLGKYNGTVSNHDGWGDTVLGIVGDGYEDSEGNVTGRNVLLLQGGGDPALHCRGGFKNNASWVNDFGEYFEWLDGNPDNEDRIGYMVQLNGDKIELATSLEKCIGVISGTTGFIGGVCAFEWHNKFLHDKWGREIIGEDGNPVINPDYNPDLEYIPREQRKEWDVVGLVGQVITRQDGTLTVGGFAGVKNGIATNSEIGYRVLKIIDNETVLLLVK